MLPDWEFAMVGKREKEKAEWRWVVALGWVTRSGRRAATHSNWQTPRIQVGLGTMHHRPQTLANVTAWCHRRENDLSYHYKAFITPLAGRTEAPG